MVINKDKDRIKVLSLEGTLYLLLPYTNKLEMVFII